jgi:hypothetical protein
MTVFSLRTGFAALAALGGLAAAADAQLPPAPAQPASPQVVKWPGGYMILNGPEVIVRNSTPGGSSTNLITGSGNGFGNKIVVSGGAGGVTVVQNARNGVGNRLILDPDDLLIDLDAILGKSQPLPVMPKIAPADPVMPPAVAPAPAPAEPKMEPAAPPSYRGKASPFWTKKAFSDAYDCNLYWCPTTKLWFRYGAEDDTYRPVPSQPAAPADEK